MSKSKQSGTGRVHSPSMTNYGKVRLSTYLDPDVYEVLLASAKKNRRAVTAEIEIIVGRVLGAIEHNPAEHTIPENVV